MNGLLDFFSLKDSVPLVLLICLLNFVGRQIGADDPTPRWWTRGFAGAGFVTYAVLAIGAWAPATAWEFLRLSVQALYAMGTAHGLALIALPASRFLYHHLWELPRERQRILEQQKARWAEMEREACEKAQQEQLERERQAEEERRKREELARQPPPPTVDERIAAAKKRYEETLQLLANAHLDEIELKAGQERAKQKYLRELDEAMK